MNPTAKRFFSILGGALIAGLSQAFPAYAPLLTLIGGTLAGAGLITFHDAGHSSVMGIDIGKKS